MVHGLFYQCPYYVSGSGNISVAFPSMQGQRALRFHQKYLNLCSEDEQRTYGFGTTWGWIIDDRIFILWWTNVSESSRTFLFSLSVFLKHVIYSPAMQRNKEGMCFESDWHVIANEKQLFSSPPPPPPVSLGVLVPLQEWAKWKAAPNSCTQTQQGAETDRFLCLLLGGTTGKEPSIRRFLA